MKEQPVGQLDSSVILFNIHKCISYFFLKKKIITDVPHANICFFYIVVSESTGNKAEEADISEV